MKDVQYKESRMREGSGDWAEAAGGAFLQGVRLLILQRCFMSRAWGQALSVVLNVKPILYWDMKSGQTRC